LFKIRREDGELTIADIVKWSYAHVQPDVDSDFHVISDTVANANDKTPIMIDQYRFLKPAATSLSDVTTMDVVEYITYLLKDPWYLTMM
jgi:hypothetical protein